MGAKMLQTVLNAALMLSIKEQVYSSSAAAIAALTHLADKPSSKSSSRGLRA
jgi:hypothetical protein